MMKKTKKRNIFINIIIILLLITGIGCLSYYIYMQLIYKKGVDYYNSIVAEYISEDNYHVKYTNEKIYSGPDIDWEGLFAQNKDLVGWIQMSPDINYPIVKGETNDEYLHRNFNKEYEYAGCIFMNCTNSSDFSDRNTILYGHNMANGSMFGDLDYYYDKTYAEENPYIYIYRPEGKYTYKIVRDLRTNDGSSVYTTGMFDNSTFASYLNDSLSASSVNYIVEPDISESDRILTLSTCVHATGSSRHIIQASLESFEDINGNIYDKESINTTLNDIWLENYNQYLSDAQSAEKEEPSS